MSKKPETLFKERIMPQLRALPKTWVYKTQEVAQRGIPDIILCIQGMFVAIELKRDSSCEPDALQRWTMDRIGESEGIAILAYPENWDTVYSVVKGLAEAEDEDEDTDKGLH